MSSPLPAPAPPTASAADDRLTAVDLCRLGRRREAETVYRRLLSAPAAAGDDLRAVGDDMSRLAEALGRHGEANLWRSFADGHNRGVGAAALWTALADGLRELGLRDAAAAAAGRAVSLAPDDAAALACLALTLVGLNQPDAAAAAAQTALRHDPGQATARRALALAALRRRRPDDAEAVLLGAPDAGTAAPETLATLALVRLQQDRLSEADALFAQAVGARPTLAEAFANYAALLARLGRDAEAAAAAARAVDLKPFLPAPHYLLGTLRRKAGRLAEAAQSFARASAADPDHLDARLNLADALRLLKQPGEAAAACRDGLTRQPDHAGLLANLGAALQQAGDDRAALTAYGRALTVAPDLPEVDNNVGRLHHAAGRRAEALHHLRRAAAARPGDPQIAGNLVPALLEAGEVGEAGRVAAMAVQANPGAPEPLMLLAHALIRLDRIAEAEAALREVLRLSSDDPGRQRDSRLRAAGLLLRAGQPASALNFLRPALADGDDARTWTLFCQAVRAAPLTAVDETMRRDLLTAFAHPAVENPHLAGPVSALFGRSPVLTQMETAADAERLLRSGALDPLAGDPLLTALLNAAAVTDPALERRLTLLRRALLQSALTDAPSPVDAAPWDGFACALALQCFFNEYVFAETDDETPQVERLGRTLLDGLAAGRAPTPGRLAVYAAYRPLRQWAGADRIAGPGCTGLGWTGLAGDLLARQVVEPGAEAALRERMPRITPIDDPVSQAVRRQYEESPHPRWRKASLLDAPAPFPRLIRAVLPHVVLDPADWRAPDVLVAGCGSGRESLWAANQIAGAQVLAVDLSLSSLAYAQRQTTALGVDNVTYAHGDLLRLGVLDRRFDLIQSVGVLHHTASVLDGWRVLVGLLRPHGLMKIGLYSAAARQSVVAARALIAEQGLSAAPDDIRRFRQAVFALPDDHPARTVVRSTDFYNASACRDLLFHVHEIRTTLPEIAAQLDELKLEFLGFQLDDPATAHRYRARFPEDPTMTRLDLWDAYERSAPLTFGGLYQFWVRRR